MEGGRDKLAGFSKRLVGKEKQVGVRKMIKGGGDCLIVKVLGNNHYSSV